MTTKNIVIISGAPGSGKSTLVNYIRKHLDIVIIEKDAIKEFFFDYIGYGDREVSKALGKAAIDAQFALARQLLSIHDSVLMETAFHADIARKDFDALGSGYEIRYLEFYCHVDEGIRRDRFSNRANSARHPGHADLIAPNEATDNLDRYLPLQLGEVVRVDTGDFNIDTDGEVIVRKIQNFIGV